MITTQQRDILLHTLGLNMRPPHDRNTYCVEVGSEDDRDVTALIEMGLMRRGPSLNDGRDYYACATEAGKKEVS